MPGYDTKDFETYFQKLRPEMLRYVLQQAVVLDVGCADGGFDQLLKAERSRRNLGQARSLVVDALRVDFSNLWEWKQLSKLVLLGKL